MSLVVILVYTLVTASSVASDSHNTDGSATNGDTGVTSCQCFSAVHSSQLTCRTPTYGCDSSVEFSHEGSCYRFVTDNDKTRNDAHGYCIDRHSHLVYIETQEELEFLQSTASETPSLNSNDYWIGLVPFQIWRDGSFVASDLVPVSNDEENKCFFIYIGLVVSFINTYSCSYQQRFVCERPKLANESNECSAGLLGFGNSCYRFYLSESSRTSWGDAKSQCEQEGSRLLRIQTNAELDYIVSQSGSIRKFWIDSIIEYGWMDGSPAFPGLTDSSDGGDDNLCLRLNDGESFALNDFDCTETFGYICERKEVRLLVPEQRNGSSSCLPTIPYNLTRIAQSGAVCLYRLRDGYSPPILYECESGEFIDECGCILQTSNGKTTVKCSCGFCDLVVDDFEEEGMSRPMLWPSNFSCSCSVNGTSFNVTVVNGGFSCVPDDPESMTTLGDDRNVQPTSSATTSTTVGRRSTDEDRVTKIPVTTDKPGTTVGSGGGEDPAGQTGVPIGIPVGVTLALLFLLVALVAAFIWSRRQSYRKRTERPLTANTHVVGSKTMTVNPTYESDDRNHATEDILKPMAAVRPMVTKTKPDNVYADIKANNAAETSEAESYAAIPSVGYTAYNPKAQKDVYTALQGNKGSNEGSNAPIPSTGYTAYKPQNGKDVYTGLKRLGNDDDDYDDPGVYTPFPDNRPKSDNKNDPESEYGDAEVVVAASGQRNGVKDVKAPAPRPKPKNLTKDSGYVCVDAPIGDSSPKGRAGYVDVDAPPVVFIDGSQASRGSQKPTGGSGYVSVDGPSVNFPVNFPDNQDNVPENDYYLKLDKPTPDDEGDYSLASTPGGNDYDILNRAGVKRPNANGPTDDGLYNLPGVPGDNNYNTFNRPGAPRPNNNAPPDDGAYSLAGLPEDDGYSTVNLAGGKPTPGVPVTNDESEYSSFD